MENNTINIWEKTKEKNYTLNRNIAKYIGGLIARMHEEINKALQNPTIEQIAIADFVQKELMVAMEDLGVVQEPLEAEKFQCFQIGTNEVSSSNEITIPHVIKGEVKNASC